MNRDADASHGLRVLLGSAPLTLEERYGSFSAVGSQQPTAGLAYLAAVAREAGHDVTILDASAECLGLDEAVAEIMAHRPQVLGLSATTMGIMNAGEVATRVKQACPDTLTVVGGCHVTALPVETLEACASFDVAVIGEGEETFRELLAAVADGGDMPMTLEGTAWRTDSGIKVNARRAMIEDLDRLPLPAWDMLRGFPGAFRPSPARIRRWPCASLVLTRGCPFSCRFCDRSVFSNRVRSYSVDRAIEILSDLRMNYGVREILVEDDTFVLNHQYVTEFCEKIIAKRLDITWSCLGRADRMTPEILRLMHRAGCWRVSYGIESGDEAILKSMRKGETLEQVKQAVGWTHAEGLRTTGFFMVGFPGETDASLKLTRELALALPLDDISVMQLTPFPGSDIYAEAEKYGQFDRNWRRMNILNTVFVPNGFTEEALLAARRDLLRCFYFRPRILFRKLLDVIRNPRLVITMFRSFIVLLRVTKTGEGKMA